MDRIQEETRSGTKLKIDNFILEAPYQEGNGQNAGNR